MPTQRFHNLPEEKRARVTEAAIAEYAEKGIDGADVAGVVRRAGIPRGSFYQYFADLDDLLGHVLSHLTQAKLRSVTGALEQAGKVPFVDYVELTFRAGLRFAESNPRLYAFGRQVYFSTNPVVARFVETARRMGVEHYAPLIDQDKARGLIRQSVDSFALAALVITVYTDAVATAIATQAGSRTGITAITGTLFDVLRHGIQTAEGAR